MRRSDREGQKKTPEREAGDAMLDLADTALAVQMPCDVTARKERDQQEAEALTPPNVQTQSRHIHRGLKFQMQRGEFFTIVVVVVIYLSESSNIIKKLQIKFYLIYLLKS